MKEEKSDFFGYLTGVPSHVLLIRSDQKGRMENAT
jgi:hypothetical protein